MRTKEEAQRWIKEKKILVLTSIPEGWKRDIGALTAPRGYFWAHNCGNPFEGTSRRALIKENPDE